jgi:hypothetical protein
MAHGGHLRPALRCDDGSHDVAPIGGTGLSQQAALGIDLQAGAVGGQPGAQGGGHRAGQVTAAGRGAQQQNGGALIFYQGREHPGVGLGAIIPQGGVVGQQHAVGAVADGLAGQRGHVLAHHHGGQGLPEGLGQQATLAHHLPRDAGGLAAELLHPHPHATAGRRIRASGLRGGVAAGKLRASAGHTLRQAPQAVAVLVDGSNGAVHVERAVGAGR